MRLCQYLIDSINTRCNCPPLAIVQWYVLYNVLRVFPRCTVEIKAFCLVSEYSMVWIHYVFDQYRPIDWKITYDGPNDAVIVVIGTSAIVLQLRYTRWWWMLMHRPSCNV